MFRTAVFALVAAFFVPSIARAEFATPRDTGDVRPIAIKRAKVERSPARVSMTATPRLTVEEVLGKINGAYMAGLQRCYRKSLVVDPSLSGKVILAFRVDDEGRVQSQLGMTTKLEDCMTKMMSGWHFSPPMTENESSYRISLVLQNF